MDPSNSNPDSYPYDFDEGIAQTREPRAHPGGNTRSKDAWDYIRSLYISGTNKLALKTLFSLTDYPKERVISRQEFYYMSVTAVNFLGTRSKSNGSKVTDFARQLIALGDVDQAAKKVFGASIDQLEREFRTYLQLGR